MTEYMMRPRGRKRYRLAESQPDLFAWANAIAAENSGPPLPHAVQVLARRFALSPSLARAVAEQAGFHLEANHG